MPTIYLYVEVLTNIRQANFYASLETQKNEGTHIDIASDKKTITVTHDGESASIYLPTEISGTAAVSIPIDRGKEMSIRLELADIKNMPTVENGSGDGAPWSANDLSPNTQLRCRVCKAEILTNELPMDFKALPSEHWAEMMDIWHCHRPAEEEPNHEKAEKEAADLKGYGSSTKVKAAAGIAFVDTTSFLLAEQSCRNVEVGPALFLTCICGSFPFAERLARHSSSSRSLPLWASRRRPLPHRQRYHVQVADTSAPNQTPRCP
jgi:ubiquitin-protein ligase E3 D